MKKRIIAAACIACMLLGLTACGGDYKITMTEKAAEFVESCPKHADAGEIVEVELKKIENAGAFVSVNDGKTEGTFNEDETVYKFKMPPKDVTIDVWYVSRINYIKDVLAKRDSIRDKELRYYVDTKIGRFQ